MKVAAWGVGDRNKISTKAVVCSASDLVFTLSCKHLRLGNATPRGHKGQDGQDCHSKCLLQMLQFSLQSDSNVSILSFLLLIDKESNKEKLANASEISEALYRFLRSSTTVSNCACNCNENNIANSHASIRVQLK